MNISLNALSQALAGGVLIGCAAVLLFFCNGRIAGISGILGGLFHESLPSAVWRYAFLMGLVAGGALLLIVFPQATVTSMSKSVPVVIVAGVLVGYGTRLGGGCTSGHGVCGNARFSARSIVATLTFVIIAMVTTFVMRHVL